MTLMAGSKARKWVVPTELDLKRDSMTGTHLEPLSVRSTGKLRVYWKAQPSD